MVATLQNALFHAERHNIHPWLDMPQRLEKRWFDGRTITAGGAATLAYPRF
jgi:hypothetical protein